MTRTIAAVLAACTLTAAGAASAQDLRIPFGDLDLASTSGAAAFDARVETAARRYCREAYRPVSLVSGRVDCERAVRDEVLQKMPQHAQVRYAVSRLPVVA